MIQTRLDFDQAATFHARLNQWLDTLGARSAEKAPHSPATFTCDTPGRKYVRIVMRYRTDHGGSAHAFYDPRTGDVYKAETWAKPAKHVRYNLLDDESFARMLAVCDPYGAYLYIR